MAGQLEENIFQRGPVQADRLQRQREPSNELRQELVCMRDIELNSTIEHRWFKPKSPAQFRQRAFLVFHPHRDNIAAYQIL